MRSACFILFLAMLTFSLSACSSPSEASPTPSPTSTPPQLKGKLVFHRYTCYECMDSEMLLYDFAKDELKVISKDWGIVNPMNGHFSPDGTHLVFMGVSLNGSWDLYLYKLDATDTPRNLTNSANYREEDPKYSADGKRIVFKGNGQLTSLTLATGAQEQLTNNSEVEYSMPYFNPAGDLVICSTGGGKESAIALIDLNSHTSRELYNRPGVAAYYPVSIDNQWFYFTASLSESQGYDQLYKGAWDGLMPNRLPFNTADADYSDAYPIDGEWLLLSSTKSLGMGNYDLYVANEKTGAIFSLSVYNVRINSDKAELGAAMSCEK